MKVRTKDELLRKVDSDRVWRIREISSLRSECLASHRSDYAQQALRRSFIPIAYAHWEGFVKKAAHYYLEFVVMQNLSLGQLNYPFLSLYLCQRFSTNLQRQNHFRLADACQLMVEDPDLRGRIRYKDIISTKSNLDSKTLRDICSTLALPFSRFETKTMFLDAGLVGKRNNIAHGELQEVDEGEMETIKTEVVGLIDIFKNEVENAATLETFKR